MNQKISDSFLMICKQNRMNKITPSNKKGFTTEGYREVVKIAEEIF